MIITGGTVFIRQADQLPQVTVRGARVVMELAEPATMDDFAQFLGHRLPGGSEVSRCTFFTLEAWSNVEAADRIAIAKAGVRNDQAPGWGRRVWQRITGKAST